MKTKTKTLNLLSNKHKFELVFVCSQATGDYQSHHGIHCLRIATKDPYFIYFHKKGQTLFVFCVLVFVQRF